jgi:anti-sigma-K factor RskA
MNVEEQLRALREAERQVTPPSRLASRLMQAFDDSTADAAQVMSQPHTPPWRRRLAAFAVAAAVALAAGVAVVNRAPSQSAPPAAAAADDVESVVLTVEPPGVEETVRIVRMRVAPSALKGIGIESDRIPPGEALVDVDVLVGEDGVARGVRLGL